MCPATVSHRACCLHVEFGALRWRAENYTLDFCVLWSLIRALYVEALLVVEGMDFAGAFYKGEIYAWPASRGAPGVPPRLGVPIWGRSTGCQGPDLHYKMGNTSFF